MDSGVRWLRGQSAVELTLVAPILIVMLLVPADFGTHNSGRAHFDGPSHHHP
jgi:Flp pilus assembly protein TadG